MSQKRIARTNESSLEATTVKAWVVLTAAGSGSRLGADVPKALAPVAGKTILGLALGQIVASPRVGGVVVTCTPGYEKEFETVVSQVLDSAMPWLVVPGGLTRQSSVYEALKAIDLYFGAAECNAQQLNPGHLVGAELSGDVADGAGSPAPGKSEHLNAELVEGADQSRSSCGPAADLPILVHDAARCLAPTELFDSIIKAIESGASAVIPVLPVVDTIKVVDPATGIVQSTPDRATLYTVQTPQGFKWEPLYQAHVAEASRGTSEADAATDDAGLLESRGVPVETVPGDSRAFKVTVAEDFVRLERSLKLNHT